MLWFSIFCITDWSTAKAQRKKVARARQLSGGGVDFNFFCPIHLQKKILKISRICAVFLESEKSKKCRNFDCVVVKYALIQRPTNIINKNCVTHHAMDATGLWAPLASLCQTLAAARQSPQNHAEGNQTRHTQWQLGLRLWSGMWYTCTRWRTRVRCPPQHTAKVQPLPQPDPHHWRLCGPRRAAPTPGIRNQTTPKDVKCKEWYWPTLAILKLPSQK